MGFNYRMPNLNAALLVAQMESLDSFLTSKRKLAKLYEDCYKKTDVKFFCEPRNAKSNYWLQTILLEDKKKRDEALEYLNKHGVMCRPIWRLLSELDMFKECQKDELKNAKFLEDRVVNIPSRDRKSVV